MIQDYDGVPGGNPYPKVAVFRGGKVGVKASQGNKDAAIGEHCRRESIPKHEIPRRNRTGRAVRSGWSFEKGEPLAIDGEVAGG